MYLIQLNILKQMQYFLTLLLVFVLVWTRDFSFESSLCILELNEASLIYKNLYASADSNVKKINFDFWNKVSQRITRNCSDVHIDYQRRAVGQKAISVLGTGTKLWNLILVNIWNSNTIVTFKSHVYQHLIEQQ